jgi:hypothetical protein
MAMEDKKVIGEVLDFITDKLTNAEIYDLIEELVIKLLDRGVSVNTVRENLPDPKDYAEVEYE